MKTKELKEILSKAADIEDNATGWALLNGGVEAFYIIGKDGEYLRQLNITVNYLEQSITLHTITLDENKNVFNPSYKYYNLTAKQVHYANEYVRNTLKNNLR